MIETTTRAAKKTSSVQGTETDSHMLFISLPVLISELFSEYKHTNLFVTRHCGLKKKLESRGNTDYILEKKLQVTVMWLSQLSSFHL